MAISKEDKAITDNTTLDAPVMGRPKGPIKKPLNVNVTLDILETILVNCGGNKSAFVDKIFREHFKRNNIEIIKVNS